ncbi:hypothetical protein BVRB_5g101340 [Beta vulgaris subsp. vulgaris]|nr:hypothetical protein BVRB_5g101340 [Beta vulgaris subsp. vulgaris]
MEIGPLGCIPTVARHPRRLLKLGGHKNEKCDEDASNSASAFNKQLPFMIQKLTSILPDSLFTIGSVYQISHDAIMHPAKYGFSDSSNPCCTTLLNGMFLCVRYQAACPDSSKHIFWDGYHPTENAFSKLVTQWIEDSSTCFPIGFKQFIEA